MSCKKIKIHTKLFIMFNFTYFTYNIKYGKLHGHHICKLNPRILKHVINFINGEKNGEFYFYRKHNNIKVKGYHINGSVAGNYISYKNNGDINKIRYFINTYFDMYDLMMGDE